MKLWCLLALAGCDAVFGIEHTTALPRADAQKFDGIPDAPFACPPTGTAPKFSVFFRQVVPQGDCDHYTTGGGIAFATCGGSSDTSPFTVQQSAVDSSTMNPVTPSALDYAMLSPDGTELWYAHADALGNGVISVYVPDGANAWKASYDAFVVTGNSFITATTPMSVGSPRHALVSISGTIHELAEVSPQMWSDVAMYQLVPTPGIVDSPPQLSPDGLRVVFHGSNVGSPAEVGVFYADRASLSAPFNAAVLLEGPPVGAATPFMTGDCSRLYFSGLGSVFYVPEQLP